MDSTDYPHRKQTGHNRIQASDKRPAATTQDKKTAFKIYGEKFGSFKIKTYLCCRKYNQSCQAL